MNNSFAMLTDEEMNHYLIESEMNRVKRLINNGEQINLHEHMQKYQKHVTDMFFSDKLKFYEETYIKNEKDSLFFLGFMLDKRRFFNRPQAIADYDHHLSLVTWTREEAIALCFGKNPKMVNHESLQTYINSDNDDVSAKYSWFINDYESVRDMMLSDPSVPERESPLFFLHWFNIKKVKIDDKLQQKVVQQGLMKVTAYHWIEEELSAALGKGLDHEMIKPVVNLDNGHTNTYTSQQTSEELRSLRTKDNYLRIIGALLAVIEGDENTGIAKHQAIKNRSALIDLIEEKFYVNGHNGLSKSHLSRLFPIAQKSLCS